jgi:hypothetical protein
MHGRRRAREELWLDLDDALRRGRNAGDHDDQ